MGMHRVDRRERPAHQGAGHPRQRGRHALGAAVKFYRITMRIKHPMVGDGGRDVYWRTNVYAAKNSARGWMASPLYDHALIERVTFRRSLTPKMLVLALLEDTDLSDIAEVKEIWASA